MATDLRNHQYFVSQAMTKQEYDEFERVNGRPYSTFSCVRERRNGRTIAGTNETITSEAGVSLA
jgi:hypothetical protein